MKRTKNVRVWLWIAGFFAIYIVVCVYCFNVRAGNDSSASVSSNAGVNISVSAGNAESLAPHHDESDQILRLQVPEDLDFVIDPWNMSGCGQIFSERFAIRNCGDKTCSLSLQGIAFTPSDQVLFVEAAGEIYTLDKANVYLEMAFENGETMVLTAKGGEYDVDLEPGCELAFRLTGAVNEKAPENWGDKEVSVILRYSLALSGL